MMQEFKTTYDKNAKFAAIAVSDDETRFFMQHIEIDAYGMEERKHYIATDGRRLHIAYCRDDEFNIGEGWKPVKTLKGSVDLVKQNPENYQFPNWKRVIPEDLETGSIEITVPENPLKDTKTKDFTIPFSQVLGDIYRWLPDDANINFRFLADLAGETWTVRINKAHTSIMATSDSGEKTAVIALMRREKTVKAFNGIGTVDLPEPKNVDRDAGQAKETEKAIADKAKAGPVETPKSRTYKFHEDAAHGWLHVKWHELIELDILHKITAYSYKYLDDVYLEEDLDCSTFLKALKAKGIVPVLETVNDGSTSHIRDFDSFPALPDEKKALETPKAPETAADRNTKAVQDAIDCKVSEKQASWHPRNPFQMATA